MHVARTSKFKSWVMCLCFFFSFFFLNLVDLIFIVMTWKMYEIPHGSNFILDRFLKSKIINIKSGYFIVFLNLYLRLSKYSCQTKLLDPTCNVTRNSFPELH